MRAPQLIRGVIPTAVARNGGDVNYGSAVVIGILVGLATGFVAERLPGAPIIQSVLAALVGSLLASLVAAGSGC